MLYYKTMGTDQIMYCIVALLLGMLLANMLKNVCGCKNVVEGQNTCVSKDFDLDSLDYLSGADSAQEKVDNVISESGLPNRRTCCEALKGNWVLDPDSHTSRFGTHSHCDIGVGGIQQLTSSGSCVNECGGIWEDPAAMLDPISRGRAHANQGGCNGITDKQILLAIEQKKTSGNATCIQDDPAKWNVDRCMHCTDQCPGGDCWNENRHTHLLLQYRSGGGG